jgi:hypothetical protein
MGSGAFGLSCYSQAAGEMPPATRSAFQPLV